MILIAESGSTKTNWLNEKRELTETVGFNPLFYTTEQIVDGMKVVVCKLKPNPLNFISIAYPTDELRLPSWFCELPFDDEAMEQTLVDEKIDNLLGVLNWDIKTNIDTNSTFNDLFTFG